jgi:hypothetical protein
LRVKSLIEFLDAAIDSKYVQGPFDERGGIMIVGPPGSFKSTIIESACENHADCIISSDLNVQQWLKMKDEFTSKRYSVLGFPEFEKLYQRHPSTAANLEGIIKALVSEGFSVGPGGDPRMPRLKAKALVIGGITTNCFEQKYEEWQKNGFLRRFIWILIGVQNPEAIVHAIRRWQKLEFGKITVRPANRQIEVVITDTRSRELEKIMKSQPGLHGTAYVLLKKIIAVLEWKYNGDRKKIHSVISDIAPSLSKNGDNLILGES